MVGNMAKMVKGRASASAKPNIPMAGETKLLVAAASTSSVPMMGPVHEKDTSTSVKAMKKRESRPVVESTFSSILLVHLEGSVSSNPPRKEMANTTSRRKKMMLKTADVARSLSAEAPKMAVTMSPRAT